jgi:hypothetical protein
MQHGLVTKVLCIIALLDVLDTRRVKAPMLQSCCVLAVLKASSASSVMLPRHTLGASVMCAVLSTLCLFQ